MISYSLPLGVLLKEEYIVFAVAFGVNVVCSSLAAFGTVLALTAWDRHMAPFGTWNVFKSKPTAKQSVNK